MLSIASWVINLNPLTVQIFLNWGKKVSSWKIDLFSLNSIFSGLVSSRKEEESINSPDSSLIGTLDGDLIVAVIEMNCQSKTKTQDAERC
jgi:hypothetical protein